MTNAVPPLWDLHPASLIAALCDAGSQVTEAEIDDDMVCVPAE